MKPQLRLREHMISQVAGWHVKLTTTSTSNKTFLMTRINYKMFQMLETSQKKKLLWNKHKIRVYIKDKKYI